MEQTKANTEVSEFKIIDDEKNTPTLKEAQDFVGGMVECITWPNGDLLIVNEEGKLMQLPLNPEATMLWRMTFTKDKYAFGYDDFANTYIQQIIAIAPRTECLETPIKDPTREYHSNSYHSWYNTEIEVDESRQID